MLQRGLKGCAILAGYLEDEGQENSIILCIASSDIYDATGKSAKKQKGWTEVVGVPEKLQDVLATVDDVEHYPFSPAILEMHIPSGVMVAGSNQRYRIGMQRALGLVLANLSTRYVLTNMKPHFRSCLSTPERDLYLEQLLVQLIPAEALSGMLDLPEAVYAPPPRSARSSAAAAASSHQPPAELITPAVTGAIFLNRQNPPDHGPYAYAVARLRVHYEDGAQILNALKDLAQHHADAHQRQEIEQLLQPLESFLDYQRELFASEHD